MRLDQFRSFAAAAKHQSLSKASAELHLSQPSISHHLKCLEDEYRIKFYHRSGRGIELTEAGLLLLENVKPILERTDRIKNLFDVRRAPASSKRKFLRVGGSIVPSTILLPSLLARFEKLHPHTKLELGTRSPALLERLLINSWAEVAVSTISPSSPELAWEFFRREKLVMFVAPSHRLAKKRRVTVSDLLAERIIKWGTGSGAGTTDWLLKEFNDRGLKFKIGANFDSPYAITQAVRLKMGVGLAFEDTVWNAVKSGEFKILKGHGLKLAGASYIVYRKNKPLSPLAREFLDLLRRARPKNEIIDADDTSGAFTRVPRAIHSP